MRSSVILSILATLAFNTFTSAVPIASPADVATTPSTPLSVPAILTNLKTTVTPLTAELAALHAGSVNVATVAPIVDQIKTEISAAISSVKLLHGEPLSVIYGVGSSAPVQGIADLLSDIITVVVATLCALFQIIGPGGDVLPLITPIVGLLVELVASLTPLVPGLLAVLYPSVHGLQDVAADAIAYLGLDALLTALGL